jgi:hypothetical protein
MPVAGAEPVPVLRTVRAYAWWQVAPDGIYFIDGSTALAPFRLLDLATGRVTTITALDIGHPVGPITTFDVSPDGQWILFKRVDQVESDIMLVENFR